jgi:hypothetical protein
MGGRRHRATRAGYHKATTARRIHEAMAGSASHASRLSATTWACRRLFLVGGEFSFGAYLGTFFTQVAPGACTVIVPGARYFVPEENPAFLLTTLETFMA